MVIVLAVVFALIAVQNIMASGERQPTAAAVQSLDFWGPFSGPHGDALDKMYDEFNASHENVSVKLTVIPWGEYYDKLSVAVAAGDTPDSCIMHSHYLPGYADQDAMMPLTEHVKKIGFKGEDYIPVLWESGVYKGVRYGVPYDSFPRLMWYNKGHFKDAGLDSNLSEDTPVKKDDLIQGLKRLTQGDRFGVALQAEGYGLRRNWLSMMWQYGGSLLTSDMKKAAFNSQAGIAALQDWVDLIYKYKVCPEGLPDGVKLFAQEKASVYISQISDKNGLKVEGIDLGAAPFPQFGREKAALALGHNLIIPRQKMDQARIDATLTLMKWLGENCMQWARLGIVPASLKLQRSDEFKQLKYETIASNQSQWLVHPPSIIPIRKIFEQAISATLPDVLTGADVKATIRKAEDQVNKILGE